MLVWQNRINKIFLTPHAVANSALYVLITCFELKDQINFINLIVHKPLPLDDFPAHVLVKPFV